MIMEGGLRRLRMVTQMASRLLRQSGVLANVGEAFRCIVAVYTTARFRATITSQRSGDVLKFFYESLKNRLSGSMGNKLAIEV